MAIVSVDSETRIVLRKVLIDVILVACLAVAVLVVFTHEEPFKRGFFCDDETLMHPYRESTVGISLGVVGFGLPFTLIIAVEFIKWKLKVNDGENSKLKLFNHVLPYWIPNVYKSIVCFLFGASCTFLITDLGKNTLGRLRPHFFRVCQPVMNDGTNCSNPINRNRYIEDYICGNTESSATQLKQIHLSFPSGHSSFSMYAMMFAAIYLHYRMNWNGSKLLKPFLQCLFVSMAWYTALSRISDYKHHWSDVAGGSLLGISICLFTIYGVSDLYQIDHSMRKLPSVLPIDPHPIETQ